MLEIVPSDPCQEQEMTAREIVRLSALRLLKAPRSFDVIDQYSLLAERQGTKYAVLPVHTSEERKLFKTLHQNNFPTINSSVWIEFAKAWSAHVDGVKVFYKTMEYLKSYFLTFTETCNHRNTVSANFTTVRPVHRALTSSNRLLVAPPPQIAQAVNIVATAQNVVSSVEDIVDNLEEVSAVTVLPRLAQPTSLARPIAPLSQGMSRPNATSNLKKMRKRRTCKMCNVAECPGSGGRRFCRNRRMA